ncbi:MAG: transcription antitermination factor NusB [Acidimicrobiales bacterium]
MTASGSGPGGRREAREEALSFLYEIELLAVPAAEAMAGRPLPPEGYARAIVEGVDADRDELDTVIGAHLTGWRVERMPIVDRVIARIATWELASRPDVPTGAVLSEAVALATQYCGEESPRFLNGVLRSVADQLRPAGG